MPGLEGLGDSMKRHIEESKLGKDKIAAALAQAQSMYGVAEKDTKGNFGDKKFASLPSVWEACIPALSSNEIAVVSYPYWCILSVPYDDGASQIAIKSDNDDISVEKEAKSGFLQLFVVVELVHSSGQKFSAELPIVPERQLNKYNKRIRSEMQDIAAAKSLGKRQLFIDLAFANVAEEDHDSMNRNNDNNNNNDNNDDDGGESQRVPVDNSKTEQFKETKEAFINDCNGYHAKFKEAGKESEFTRIVSDCGFDTLKGINKVDDMEKIIAALMEGIKKLEKSAESTTESQEEKNNGKP